MSTRNEDILQAILDGDMSNLPAPQSRNEALLQLLGGKIGDVADDVEELDEGKVDVDQGTAAVGKVLAVGSDGKVTTVPAGTAGVTTAGDVAYVNGSGYTSGSAGAAMESMEADVTQLNGAVGVLDADFYGADVADFSVILSNNNGAVTNNHNGTYSIGTNDYGTTVFAEQLSLAPGRYLLSGTPTGYMCVSTSTNPNDRFVIAKTDPVLFEIDETTSCYLCFRMDAKATAAFTITPYIKPVEIKENVKYLAGLIKAGSKITDITSRFVSGGFINTNVSVGSAIAFEPTVNAGYSYCVHPCKEGEAYVVTGNGGTNSLLWAFVDEDFKIVSKSGSDIALAGQILIAPANGYIIVNANLNYAKKLIQITLDDSADYTRITDPHQLFWRMGTFDKTHLPQTGIFTDRMFMTCRVKAGSTIMAPSTGGVNISFGYKVDDSSTELDNFKSYSYGTVGITQDCTIYVGVLFNTPVFIPNDSLLDNLTFDLRVIDYKCKYSKKDSGAFGNPIDVYYEGQHTDATGWTNATTDVDEIHAAFDALVTASNGYLTKTDLGVAYDTYHMYQYDTYPVPATYGTLKVPKVAIFCCTHGNEKMSAYAVYYLLHDLINKATKNPALAYLRSNCKLSIIPIANPWGFINTSRWNESGVNLNRNFPTYNWNDYNDETSGQGGINYKGSAPASEGQTKMIMGFLRKNYDAVFAIDLHTNGENTSEVYEISAAIIPKDPDPTSDAYSIQDSYVVPAKVYTNRIKPWLDETYGVNLGGYFYGAVTSEPDRPTASQWIRESNNMVGITYEVLAGSSNAYLGANLGKYAPATIKAAAEELGNFLVAMLIHCKET